jgi:hypothetical protein
MHFSRFFIDRPVFATVLSLLILLVGVVSIIVLPVDRYPQIVPPAVNISTSYPGADAETVAESVAAPLEQRPRRHHRGRCRRHPHRERDVHADPLDRGEVELGLHDGADRDRHDHRQHEIQ